MMGVIKRIIKGIVISVIIIVVLLIVDILISWKGLKTTHYIYENEKLTKSISAVQLTDLHNSQFGWKNVRLIKKIRNIHPDIIFMTGDMLNDDNKRTDIVEHLITKLSEIAPVYYSFGNQESDYIKNYDTKEAFIKKIENAGAIVLEQEFEDVTINGQKVRIGGLYGYVLSEKLDWMDGSEQRFMEKFENTDRFTILLSHMPEGLYLWKSMEKWNIDLVFSGHVHGGQVRLPVIGGLYEPEQGFFPTTITKGMHKCGNGTMVLSAGLGSEELVPRINNIPEIVVCEMKGSDR